MSRFIFLGTGTSNGVPVIGCQCEVCTSSDPRDKRLRCSGYYESNTGTKILIDIGPDFRQQALTHNITRIDGLLITHSHYDHIGGLDEVRQINFIMKKPIDVYGSQESMRDIQNRFSYIFSPTQIGGGIPQISLHPLDEKPFTINDVSIIPLPVWHGKLLIFGYKIGNFAYITDASGIPEETKSKLMNIDTLVINALRYRPHPTHFNIEQALAFVSEVRPQKTYFIHMTDDILHSRTSRELPKNVFLAYDGLTLMIND
ncbi:MBL fold metallo-hydrolase [Thermospira aquatica]|uniref:MBL fold metallo-hydrolase n=1 Tax=Thermospira aquatica TaxID=2828656 RepID=A0AAX3BDZ9_9SPIR|nr:MBL fold metallo-hydrolase [Thermospira aquatica]URA09946.1 MBL fold metallo-hydrolase [Thermospira aquatica]